MENFEADDSSDDNSTCSRSEGGSSVTNSSGSSVDPSISMKSSSTTAIEKSFKIPAPLKKKVRRTKAQIEIDLALKDALKLYDKSNQKTDAAKSKTVSSAALSTTTSDSTITVGEETFSLQAARTQWSTKEQMDLILSYKTWEEQAKLSQSKKLIPISKLWLIHIPILMGKKFGRVRPTPNNILANSPYQYKWLAIRKKVSNFTEKLEIFL